MRHFRQRRQNCLTDGLYCKIQKLGRSTLPIFKHWRQDSKKQSNFEDLNVFFPKKNYYFDFNSQDCYISLTSKSIF
jgi:hypothetical protein